MKWYEIEPRDAVDIDCTTRPDLDPPVNENGDVCPWPWDSQQLKNAPLGQYHCPYCMAMVVAGLLHPDYRVTLVLKTCETCEYAWQGPDDGIEPCPECGEMCMQTKWRK